ncbi:uncharacterized protein V2V93DRAFT_214631 [Kockiozyma suomiensis]|uniref:uncharacterized protein n=1 Tax=Kockiozyma suomiensis TaxID=1337062 RepID=UPI00334418CB
MSDSYCIFVDRIAIEPDKDCYLAVRFQRYSPYSVKHRLCSALYRLNLLFFLLLAFFFLNSVLSFFRILSALVYRKRASASFYFRLALFFCARLCLHYIMQRFLGFDVHVFRS